MAPRLIRRNREIGVATLTRREVQPFGALICSWNMLCTWRKVGMMAVTGWPCSGTNASGSGELLANRRAGHAR